MPPIAFSPLRDDYAMNIRLQIEQKVVSGVRLTTDEGLYLIKEAPLHWMGSMADVAKARHVSQHEVTFLIDTNPNYTNVCDTNCQFCAFYRTSNAADAYTLSIEQVMDKISTAVRQGATTVLLQGGHNPAIPMEYYLDLVRETRRRFPEATPHFFSASEIQTMARISGLSTKGVLEKLKEAGQTTLPGGGAEILSERVRKAISPKKGGPDAWLSIHREAHQLGFLTTATMMYGHIEGPNDILEHWNSIRDLQDEALSNLGGGRFTAFIPWSFKPDNSALGKTIQEKRGPLAYFRVLAASRLYLDNFQHIQASWFSEGKKAGQLGLLFGGDDFGGTLFEENVHMEAGYVNSATVEEVIRMIHEAGFDAVQRTTTYDIVKRFPKKNEGFKTADDTVWNSDSPSSKSKS